MIFLTCLCRAMVTKLCEQPGSISRLFRYARQSSIVAFSTEAHLCGTSAAHTLRTEQTHALGRPVARSRTRVVVASPPYRRLHSRLLRGSAQRARANNGAFGSRAKCNRAAVACACSCGDPRRTARVRREWSAAAHKVAVLDDGDQSSHLLPGQPLRGSLLLSVYVILAERRFCNTSILQLLAKQSSPSIPSKIIRSRSNARP
jgi:hypothetical protein